MERTDQTSEGPTPHTLFAWDDDDNKPVIPRLPHPRTPEAAAR